MSGETILISTVTPVYRGEEYLRRLVQELEQFRTQLSSEGWPIALAEAIFVDDGSVDGSRNVLAQLEREYSWVRVISLSKNFGQHSATAAGILHSSGDWVATLDEDLQHRPTVLIDMFREAMTSRADIVYANPLHPVHGSFFRDGASKTFKWILSRLSGNPAVRRFNSFRFIRGTVARAAAAVSSYDAYFDVTLGWFSDRVADIRIDLVDERFRKSGTSGYNLRQLMRHGRKMLFASQVKMLRLGTLVGFAAFAASIIAIMFILVAKLWDPQSISIAGWPTLAIGILFFGGLHLFILGISLEYIALLVHGSQGRPTFLVIDRSRDEIVKQRLLGG